ncbi:MAG: hypothetical protein SGJ09_17460 [Phycisphaerae bacterium]|nr:hypothetical protein [Phycisphaerae bacterium]MDZ4831967.1 hypothetical protein [Phycisphaerae bacterium]
MPDSLPDHLIIDDVRRNREQLLRAAGGSIDELFAKLKDAESKDQREVVKLLPRRIREAGLDAA